MGHWGVGRPMRSLSVPLQKNTTKQGLAFPEILATHLYTFSQI
ncbi:MAG: hypothetical protein V7K67_24845 [Nostoc sp.]